MEKIITALKIDHGEAIAELMAVKEENKKLKEAARILADPATSQERARQILDDLFNKKK